MKLRYISLHISFDSKDNFRHYLGYLFDRQFDFNARFICNYLSKAVKKLNIETSQYRMLGVELHPTKEEVRLKAIDCLCVCLRYTHEDLNVLLGLRDLPSRFEYYLSLLQRGYEFAVAEGYTDIRIEKLLQLHEQFRALGYKNEWLWKKRQLKDKGLYIYFKCYFTTFDFRLELEAYTLKTKELLAKGIVLQTLPDEIFFAKEFRKVVYEQDKIVILDFLDHSCMQIDLSKLCQGKCHVTYLDEDLKHWVQKYPEEIAGITW